MTHSGFSTLEFSAASQLKALVSNRGAKIRHCKTGPTPTEEEYFRRKCLGLVTFVCAPWNFYSTWIIFIIVFLHGKSKTSFPLMSAKWDQSKKQKTKNSHVCQKKKTAQPVKVFFLYFCCFFFPSFMTARLQPLPTMHRFIIFWFGPVVETLASALQTENDYIKL